MATAYRPPPKPLQKESVPKQAPIKRVPRTVDPSKIRKNDQGGVLIKPDEIEAAFKYLDIQGKGYVGVHNLRKRLNIFYNNKHGNAMPLQQYKSLLGDKTELTLKDLNGLLLTNTVENYDPVAEAFKVYDPKVTGYLSTDILKEIFNDLELIQLTDEDLGVLLRAADADGDGRINLEDFRLLAEEGRGPPLQRGGGEAQARASTDGGAGAGGSSAADKSRRKSALLNPNEKIGPVSLKRTMKAQALKKS